MGCGASRSVPTIKQGNSQRSIPIRIMLIGKTGAGKSALFNAILGNPKFETAGHLMESETGSCKIESAVIDDMNIDILDTPGLMGTNQDEEQIMQRIFKGTSNLFPGPHVFLLVIRADAKFTKEDTETVDIFSNVFGEEMYKHLIVVFTHKSALDKSNTTVKDCLMQLPATFQQLKECCIAIETGGKAKQVKKEVKKLLQVVEIVIKRNKGGFYPDKKIKEIEKEYMERNENKRGLRAKGKEQVQEIAGVAYDKVVDVGKGVIGKYAAKAVAAVKAWLN